jgi:hypothetical protein
VICLCGDEPVLPRRRTGSLGDVAEPDVSSPPLLDARTPGLVGDAPQPVVIEKLLARRHVPPDGEGCVAVGRRAAPFLSDQKRSQPQTREVVVTRAAVANPSADDLHVIVVAELNAVLLGDHRKRLLPVSPSLKPRDLSP